MLAALGHAVWVALMLTSGYHGWGIWIPVVTAVGISYINRKWHLNNGCSEGRAVIIGTIFILALTLPLYLLGSWIERMP